MALSCEMTQGAFHHTSSPQVLASVTESEASSTQGGDFCQGFPGDSHCLNNVKGCTGGVEGVEGVASDYKNLVRSCVSLIHKWKVLS